MASSSTSAFPFPAGPVPHLSYGSGCYTTRPVVQRGTSPVVRIVFVILVSALLVALWYTLTPNESPRLARRKRATVADN
jgi:hypothetical protein